MVLCLKCGEVKPESGFTKEARRPNGLAPYCRPCKQGYDRERKLLNRFGLTAEDYERVLTEQGHVCAICGEIERVVDRRGKIRHLSVDHDHETGEVRGLLCFTCNVGIGAFKERRDLVEAAAHYLAVSECRGTLGQIDNGR